MIKEIPSIKIMLFGIMILIVGGFIITNPSLSCRGIEFVIIIAGMIIGMVGFIQEN